MSGQKVSILATRRRMHWDRVRGLKAPATVNSRYAAEGQWSFSGTRDRMSAKPGTGFRQLARLIAVLFALVFTFSLFAQETVVRFGAVDIYVDSKDKPLAAYQLEFSAPGSDLKITGIEGGEPAAFSHPPYYDPKAMQQERVVIAAFSTNTVDALPFGKTRVATIHFQFRGQALPAFQLKLKAAADSRGNKIGADASAQERKPK